MSIAEKQIFINQRLTEPLLDRKTYTTKKKNEIARNIFLCYTVINNTIGEEK